MARIFAVHVGYAWVGTCHHRATANAIHRVDKASDCTLSAASDCTAVRDRIVKQLGSSAHQSAAPHHSSAASARRERVPPPPRARCTCACPCRPWRQTRPSVRFTLLSLGNVGLATAHSTKRTERPDRCFTAHGCESNRIDQ